MDLEKRTNKIIHLLLFVTTLILSIDAYSDTDLFYMIPTGQYILDHGIPHTNPFVTTSGLQMIIQNWLYCVVIAITHNVLKSPGLYILMTIQLYIMIIVLYKIIKPNNDPILAFIATTISARTIMYINIRPQILTTTLILIQLLTLHRYRTTKNTKWLYIWPLLTLIEINTHASYWIMHYIILIPYFVPFINTKWVTNDHLNKSEKKHICIATLTTIPSLFINPYGTKMISYVFKSITSPEFNMIKEYISEQTPGYLSIDGLPILMITSMIVLLLIHKKNMTSSTLYMFAGISILLFTTLKWVSFEPIVCILLSKQIIKNKTLNNKILNNDNEYKKTIACIMCIGILAILLATQNQSFLTTRYDEMKPLVDKIQKHDPNAYVYARFERNNYLVYRGFKTNNDARPELYTKALSGKSTDILKNIYKILNSNTNPGFYQNFLKKENFDYLIIGPGENGLKLYLNMHPEEYTKIAVNKSMTLYKQNNY